MPTVPRVWALPTSVSTGIGAVWGCAVVSTLRGTASAAFRTVESVPCRCAPTAVQGTTPGTAGIPRSTPTDPRVQTTNSQGTAGGPRSPLRFPPSTLVAENPANPTATRRRRRHHRRRTRTQQNSLPLPEKETEVKTSRATEEETIAVNPVEATATCEETQLAVAPSSGASPETRSTAKQSSANRHPTVSMPPR